MADHVMLAIFIFDHPLTMLIFLIPLPVKLPTCVQTFKPNKHIGSLDVLWVNLIYREYHILSDHCVCMKDGYVRLYSDKQLVAKALLKVKYIKK